MTFNAALYLISSLFIIICLIANHESKKEPKSADITRYPPVQIVAIVFIITMLFIITCEYHPESPVTYKQVYSDFIIKVPVFEPFAKFTFAILALLFTAHRFNVIHRQDKAQKLRDEAQESRDRAQESRDEAQKLRDERQASEDKKRDKLEEISNFYSLHSHTVSIIKENTEGKHITISNPSKFFNNIFDKPTSFSYSPNPRIRSMFDSFVNEINSYSYEYFPILKDHNAPPLDKLFEIMKFLGMSGQPAKGSLRLPEVIRLAQDTLAELEYIVRSLPLIAKNHHDFIKMISETSSKLNTILIDSKTPTI